jgi:hypothetical protein
MLQLQGKTYFVMPPKSVGYLANNSYKIHPFFFWNSLMDVWRCARLGLLKESSCLDEVMKQPFFGNTLIPLLGANPLLLVVVQNGRAMALADAPVFLISRMATNEDGRNRMKLQFEGHLHQW